MLLMMIYGDGVGVLKAVYLKGAGVTFCCSSDVVAHFVICKVSGVW